MNELRDTLACDKTYDPNQVPPALYRVDQIFVDFKEHCRGFNGISNNDSSHTNHISDKHAAGEVINIKGVTAKM